MHVFEAVDQRTVCRLVREHPLAWIAPEATPFASPAPVQLCPGDRLATLAGHVSRTSNLAEAFRSRSQARFQFIGPGGYVSPSWFRNRKQAPTWSYVSVQFRATAELVDDPEFLREHLQSLCHAMENGRANPWRLEELGERYEALATRLVAFRAEISASSVRFKLGQDETTDTLADILAALGTERADDLRDWMIRLNARRV